MRWRHVRALVIRYTILYTRSAPRVVEMFFWPFMDLFVWGFVTMYLLRVNGAHPSLVTFLLGAMIFWDIIYRAAQGVSISFLEDVWSRNLLNVFVAPVRVSEFIAASYAVGLLKVLTIALALTGGAYLMYSFNLFSMGFALVPLFANLVIMGWSIGMLTTALLMRWGQAAENLAWAVPFLIQPIAAVFYPVSVLPAWLQPVAFTIPASHVFEGMRQVLRGEPLNVERLIWAFVLNLVYLALAAWSFNHMFHVARRKGLLTKLFT